MSTFSVYKDVYSEVFSSVLGKLSMCNRRHESDQNPTASPIQKGALRKRSSVTAPIKVIKTQSQPNPSNFPKGSFEEKV